MDNGVEIEPVQWSPGIESAPTFVSCRVHGSVQLPYPVRLIVDTPQFQRLRRIKQLGLTFLVYPGADYSRLEHSIGVCHLAWQLMQSLQLNQPDLNITNNDVLVVSIAALCHDLGHGPFSHFFDQGIVPKLLAEPIKHEEFSTAMFDHLLDSNPTVKHYLDQYLTNWDYQFIKEAIDGRPRGDKEASASDWHYVGRSADKSFMYDVVSNKFDGLDVDRYDYVLRDQAVSGVSTRANRTTVERILHYTRALKIPPDMQRYRLCYAEKVIDDLTSLFSARYDLHNKVYQHKTVKAFEALFTEVFMCAAEHLRFYDSHNTEYSLAECLSLERMDLYEQLDDVIIERIRFSIDEKLKPARERLLMADRRQCHKLMGELSADQQLKVEELENELLRCVAGLKRDQLHITQAPMHHGSGGQNPMLQLYVYPHKTLSSAVPWQLDKQHVKYCNMSATMKKFVVYVFYRGAHELDGDAQRAFDECLKRYGLKHNLPVQKRRRVSDNRATQPPPPPLKKAQSDQPPRQLGDACRNIYAP